MSNIDPYFDESIGDLRNLIGAASSEELKTIEPQIVFANELAIDTARIDRSNDLTELLAIHRHLFKEIYDWAGTIRTVDIKKNNRNAEFFLIVDKIYTAAEYIFTELHDKDHLKNLPRTEFVKQLAYFYDQLNYVHPFREGNGRTQRIFWTRVAHDAGFDIAWDAISKEENDEASRLAAETMDRTLLEQMFDTIVTTWQHNDEKDTEDSNATA